jgi:hypothetical protein
LLLLPLAWLLLQLLQAAVLPAQLLVLADNIMAPERPQEQVAVNAVPEPDGSTQLRHKDPHGRHQVRPNRCSSIEMYIQR